MDQVLASIRNEPVFKLFSTIRLRKNMRADKDQIEFSKWLCEIGAGKKYVKGTKEIELPNENTRNLRDSETLAQLINYSCRGISLETFSLPEPGSGNRLS